MTAGQALPELASVPWRARTDQRWLRRWGRIWHAWTLLYTVPFIAAAAGMLWLDPITAPVALVAAAHAWIIPELYAARGATVATPKGPRRARAEPVAAGPARPTCSVTTSASCSARPAWRSSAASSACGWSARPARCSITPGGRRVHCLLRRRHRLRAAPSDRVAHLLLALRVDEEGFATVANHAFAGAPWRVRRRLPARMRPAIDEARCAARLPAAGSR